MIMKEPTVEQRFLAFTCLYKVSPYYQFAHFTANQAILEAFEKDQDSTTLDNGTILHVIDFDISYGFQWSSLIQSLSETASTSGCKRISLKLTGYGRSLQELQETEGRLMSFAKGFHNVVFKFKGLLTGSKLMIRENQNETIAVNLAFHLNNNNNFVGISETLKSVHSLRPSIVTLVEQEGNNPRSVKSSFLPRFMESLNYFAAMFDSLDDCLPQESGERLSIEKNHLGKEIKAMINYSDGLEEEITWKKMMERDGFEGMKLSSKCLIQAKLLLKMRTHNYSPFQCEGDQMINGGFRVFQRDEGKALSMGWQDRCLLTASAWKCV